MANTKLSSRTYVTMNPELQQQLQEYADKRQLPQSAVIRQALLEYLERYTAKVPN